MSIKIIIANNNDILYSKLSNIILQKRLKAEVLNIPKDKLIYYICQAKKIKNLIVLDENSSISFCNNILKNTFIKVDKKNIIILVINSKNICNTINQENSLNFKEKTNLSLFELSDIITSTIKDTLEIEKIIDSILWKMNFTSYFKGTIYLKKAILFAYENNDLFNDMNNFIKKLSEKNNVSAKSLRSSMDKSLNTVLDSITYDTIYEIFGNDYYDGRKISLKYFIDLCIHYLEKQRCCCFDY